MLFMGATIAVAGMLSNLYLQTIFIFLPMIAEFFLKSRGHFRAENYSTNSANEHLEYHGRIESITHVIMRSVRVDERKLVAILWAMEALTCGLVLVIDIVI